MSQSPASLLRAEGVGVSYRLAGKTLPVLEDVSISIFAGERVAIVGPSGAGKSTLLHVLGGLQNPTGGRVFIQEQDVYRMPSATRTAMRAKRIGFVFQSYHLLPELDVLENVMLPAMAVGRLNSEVRASGLRLLKAVGLEERWNHTPLELSGGEQQRVALARSLMNDPEILFADEPTGSLDSKTGALVLRYLFELTASRSRTLVIVTHNAEVAAACMRTIRMKDGRVED